MQAAAAAWAFRDDEPRPAVPTAALAADPALAPVQELAEPALAHPDVKDVTMNEPAIAEAALAEPVLGPAVMGEPALPPENKWESAAPAATPPPSREPAPARPSMSGMAVIPALAFSSLAITAGLFAGAFYLSYRVATAPVRMARGMFS